MRRQQCAMSETTGCTTTERCPGCAWPSSCGAHASAAGERRGAKGGRGRCAAKTRGLDSVPGRGVPTRRPCGVQGWREAAPGACAPSAHPAEASQYSYDKTDMLTKGIRISMGGSFQSKCICFSLTATT